MPTYTFKAADGSFFLKRLTFEQYETVASGEMKLVDDQDKEAELVFNPGEVGLVFKDGASGGWASKAMKENKYREERRNVMTRREKDHVFKTRLIPNFQGAEAHSWSDVQDHVRVTKGVESAKTYDRFVAKEKR